MLGNYYTFPELLLWIPLLTGIIIFFIKNSKSVKIVALLSSLLTLGVSVTSLFYSDFAHHPQYLVYNNVSYVWMPYIGSSFSVGLDGMGFLLTFLTAFSFPLIFAITHNREYKNTNVYYGLMLLAQAGMTGVFVATDALVFYFFWELALIPMYFLCSRWGGEFRIRVTFKFFIYTFVSSLLMLTGILYIYFQTSPVTAFSDHSFFIKSFYNASLSPYEQEGLFWLFFVAFAVKMPLFPFHSWQPDLYEQSSDSSVMVLSGLMVKMGIFGLLRWLLPIFPEAVGKYQTLLITLSVISILYGSLIALVQSDLKRIVAWSSIAHIGLMGAAVFARNNISLQGVMIEMFNHGINIIALWMVVDIIEKKTGIRKLNELGGLALKSPALSIFFLIIVLANIALPLTNGFVGEFLMFTGLFEYNKILAAFASISVIISATYMLNMMQKVFFGTPNSFTENVTGISMNQKLVLSVIVLTIFIIGIYPGPVLHLTQDTVSGILKSIR
jgi:NADH-quinone oxidoreductase subunit M